MLIKRSRRAQQVAFRRKIGVLGLVCLAGLLIIASPALVHAQAKVATTGAQFLELGVSARSMGMADAFTAVANDVSAVYYNPAGLTSLWGREVMATYVKMPADINYGFFAAGFPLESIGGVLGIGFQGLSSGRMVERTYEQGPDYPYLKGTGREFSADSWAVSVSYGRYLTDRFSVGFTMKYIGNAFHTETAGGWAADVGTSYDTGFRGFKIAMVITNFGPDQKFISQEYPLPINFKFGGCINLLEDVEHLLTLTAEGTHPSDNLEKYNIGAEYVFKDRFVLRSGGRLNYDVDGFTAGGGVRLPMGEDSELRVDYAYQDFGILTEIHRISMSLAF